MRRPVARLALLAVLCSLATTTATAGPPEEWEELLRTFRLRHLRAPEANALLRGVADVRRSAIDEGSQAITVRAPRSVVRDVEALLKDWDRPPAHWRGRLVAVTSSRDVELSSFELEDEQLMLSFEGGGGDALRVDLETDDVRERSLSGLYRFRTSLDMPSGVPRFARGSSGRLRLGGEGELSVVRAPTEAQRAELAELLGVERPVKEVVLRLSPVR